MRKPDFFLECEGFYHTLYFKTNFTKSQKPYFYIIPPTELNHNDLTILKVSATHPVLHTYITDELLSGVILIENEAIWSSVILVAANQGICLDYPVSFSSVENLRMVSHNAFFVLLVSINDSPNSLNFIPFGKCKALPSFLYL